MKVGELIVWNQPWVYGVDPEVGGYSQTVGMLIRILKVDIQNEELFEIKTFKGETILAPRSECSAWSCPKNPGCYCGACH